MNAARLFARIEDLAAMVWADVQAGGVEDWLQRGAPDGEQTLADIAEPVPTTRYTRR